MGSLEDDPHTLWLLHGIFYVEIGHGGRDEQVFISARGKHRGQMFGGVEEEMIHTSIQGVAIGQDIGGSSVSGSGDVTRFTLRSDLGEKGVGMLGIMG